MLKLQYCIIKSYTNNCVDTKMVAGYQNESQVITETLNENCKVQLILARN